MKAQVALARKLQFFADNSKNANSSRKKGKGKGTKARQDSDELILSKEMLDVLKGTLEEVDDDGYLVHANNSRPPLDGISVFCPTASTLLHSKTAALRIPENVTSSFSSSNSFASSANNSMNLRNSYSLSDRPTHHSTTLPVVVDRLEVLWLQRRAQFELEDGHLEKSFETLNEAIKLHIGETSYEQSRLDDKVISSDPYELLDAINNDFEVFDDRSHLFAARIQRLYRKRYNRRMLAASLISSVYRGHKVRKQNRIKKSIDVQCARILQRRFRKHLLRMNHLATKIKKWFKTCQIIRDYLHRLHEYRMARRIQTIIRGHQARRWVRRLRVMIKASSLIQRNVRGYILRKKRAFVIQLYHKMFYLAARKIQCMVRCKLAVERAKFLLLEQLNKEEHRLAREKEVRDEAVQVEMRRAAMYVQTDAGRRHLEEATEAVILRDRKFESVRPKLMPQDILGHEALVAFEVFDVDGSGLISVEDLHRLLRELCVPVTPDETDEIARELQVDNRGNIDFNAFLDWYTEGRAQRYSESSIRKGLQATFLRYRKRASQLTSQRNRVEVELIRQRCAWIVDTATALFRLTSPPKYQCCRCLHSFVLFTDYFVHFDSDHNCVVTGEKGLFFPKFWVQSEWINQRQCEQEVIRRRNEQPWIQHRALLARFTDQALQSDRALRAYINDLIKKARRLYYAKLRDPNRLNVKSKLIMNVVSICKDGVLRQEVAKIVAKCIRRKLPESWLMENIWTLSGFELWLQQEVDRKGLRGGLRNEGRVDIALRSVGFLSPYVMWEEALVLAKIHVLCMRAMQVSLEASIVAQSEYRKSHPRRITVPDKDLRRALLPKLTSEHYDMERKHLVQGLAYIDASVLNIIKVDKQIHSSRWSDTIASGLSKYARISPYSGRFDSDTIKELIIADAHARALARHQLRMRTPVGKTQCRRKAYEHWADQTLYTLRKLSINDNAAEARSEGNIRYIFHLFRSLSLNQGIDVRDFEIVERILGIVTPTEAARQDIIDELDPDGTGYIEEGVFFDWLRSAASRKYDNSLRKLLNILFYDSWNVFGNSYKNNAQDHILVNLRRLYRLEMETAHAHMEAIVPMVGEDFKFNDTFAEEMRKRDEIEADLFPTLASERTQDERAELALLHRMAADKAEKKCRRNFLTARGQRHLHTEKLIVGSAKQIMSAYGYCFISDDVQQDTMKSFSRSSSFLLGEEERHWDVFVKPLLLAFDTDCSGSFDEYEVNMIMKYCFQYLSQGSILYTFPEVRTGSVGLERVTRALGKRLHQRMRTSLFRLQFSRMVSPGGLAIPTKSNLTGAWMMLVSLNRQVASDLSQEATIVTHSEAVYSTGDDHRNEHSLLYRCQMLAMRQVKMYQRTMLGQIHSAFLQKQFEESWKVRINRIRPSTNKPAADILFTPEDIVSHAYSMHKDWKGMLVTELPHLVRYLVKRWRARPNQHMAKVGRMVASIRKKKQLFWMSESDVMCRILPALDFDLKTAMEWTLLRRNRRKFERYMRFDAEFVMMSQARQQAIMIALGFLEIRVAETNYRCYVLGLEKIMKKRSQVARWGIFLGNDINQSDNKNYVPKESMSLLLLAKGFDMATVLDTQSPLADFLSVTSFKSGVLNKNPVDVTVALSVAHTQFSQSSSRLKKAVMAGRRLLSGYFSHATFERMVRSMRAHSSEIDVEGAVFLKEIISGVSHNIRR